MVSLSLRGNARTQYVFMPRTQTIELVIPIDVKIPFWFENQRRPKALCYISCLKLGTQMPPSQRVFIFHMAKLQTNLIHTNFYPQNVYKNYSFKKYNQFLYFKNI